MNDSQRPTDDDLARQLRSAMVARAQDVEVEPGDIQALVATARVSALNGPSLRSSVVPVLAALAALIVMSALILLAVGGGSSQSSPAVPSVPAAPSPQSAPSAPSPISVGRDPTGIPETLDGQPVTIGLAAVLYAQATTDATPFLIGGWFTDGSGNACSGGVGQDPSPLFNGCGTVIGGDSPWGDYSFPGPQGRMFWDGRQLPNGVGPSIVKVHTHDSRSADCRPETQAQCLAIVVVDDGPAAERLAPALLRDGWSMERTLYMSWRREPDRPPRPGVGREISEPEIRKLQAEIYGEDSESASPVAAALIATLVAGQDAVRASTTALCFGAGEGDAMSASCTLFLERADGHGGIAMVDEVGTLIAHRRRGLGRAVVAAALEAARRMRCAPILVPADADDWPRKLYQRMGFEPLGRQVSFTLTPAR